MSARPGDELAADPAERGLRILAEMLEEAAASRRSRALAEEPSTGGRPDSEPLDASRIVRLVQPGPK